MPSARLLGAAGLAGAFVVAIPPASHAQAAGAGAADRPLRLQFESRLDESRAAVREGRPVYGSGERLTGRTGRDTTIEGDAELRQAGTVLRADRITWYDADEEVFAVGNVRITRDGNVFAGPQLRLKLDTNEGSFASPAYYLPQYRGRGRADLIEFLGPDRTRFIGASYTTCEPDDPDWILQARTLTLDEAEGEGTGRSASLSFMGMKILALPVFAFPLGDERKSGFLPPTLSINSRTGFDVVAPYYWNIAPNRDFTLYPRLSTKRGAQIGGEFRYLERRYSGQIDFEVNPNDLVTGESRHYYGLRHGFSGYAGWSGGWNVRGVSDDNYFVDYSRSILTSADRVLPQHFFASRSLGADWSMLFDVQKWQPILDARPGPYERVPRVQLRQVKRDVAGFDVDTTIEATQFAAPTPTGAQGWRFFANPQVSWPIVRPGWSIVPKVSLHASAYQLDRNGVFDTSLTRVVPTFSVDAGLVFERSTRFFDREVTQTLEPRLFYARTPYRDQTEFPVFDAATTDFSFAQLFSENTFVGHDRIADVNQLTAAAVSRLVEPATGAERLRFAVGQRVYFSDQRVTLPGGVPLTDGRSDILLAAGGQLAPGMSFDTGLQYSVESSRVPRFSAVWRWLPKEGQVLNVGTRYRREEIGQFDTSWRWPLSGRWMSMGRLNYSFLDRGVDPVSRIPNQRGIVESVLGVEYDACCWISRVVLQRYTTGVDTATTALFFQLELKGLGRIGSDPFDILRRNIPGFRVPDVTPGATSRYFGYE
ncbi:LPS-assembly protein LptD [Burkholderiaceae bacterium FT117]|uniref:LPS-assembly protein LptD n=1 Tax=Zeimonas sediminis TaxID=2944268 RepID=UPI002342F194|nr:LPS-assembly protein LptD [Zeimonas sediminis]MCM5570296.1 LPS-assembly protein LptD [Zeimonas sediminis]